MKHEITKKLSGRPVSDLHQMVKPERDILQKIKEVEGAASDRLQG